MAVVAIPTPSLVNPTNEQMYTHRQYLPAATIAQGVCCIWDANRKIIPTGGTAPAASVPIAGVALRSDRPGGQAISLLQKGFLWGLSVSGLALGSKLYAGVNGAIETTGTVVIGSVIPFGAGGELAAWIDVEKTWGA